MSWLIISKRSELYHGDALMHYGVKGMKWGVQNLKEDGSIETGDRYSKYKDKPWYKNGGIKEMQSEVLYNLRKGVSAERVIEYLVDEYDMTEEDAKFVVSDLIKNKNKVAKQL